MLEFEELPSLIQQPKVLQAPSRNATPKQMESTVKSTDVDKKKVEFCDDEFHEERECDGDINDEEKKEIAKRKNICLSCFAKSAYPEKQCKNVETCGGWWSLEHHEILCPKRAKGIRVFFPTIDEILWSRFAKFLDFDEQVVLKLSSPNGHKYVNLNNVRYIRSFEAYTYRKLLNDDPKNVYVVTNFLVLRGSNDVDLFKSMITKLIIFCKARFIELQVITISAQDLSHILTTYTREIKVEKLNSDITFAEIIKLSPNIESFIMCDTSLKVDEKSWVEDLLRYKKGNNFQKLFIRILYVVEFDVESLKKFVTTKSINRVNIKIRYESKKLRETLNKFIEKNSELLIEGYHPVDEPDIILGFDRFDDFRTFTIKKSDKIDSTAAKNSKVMPTRTAKKRCIRYADE
uniref:Uncharacterized protein n=1 Tax=Panagrolaimus davidi TaxID=227884 RepID=A0A914Q5G6_9BILA